MNEPYRCPSGSVVVALFGALLSCSDSGPISAKHGEPISEQAAIQRAEAFVRAQGYTDTAPTAPLQRESLERDPDHQVIEQRRNTLKSRACGAMGTGDRTSWMVGFRYQNADQSVIRIVSVNADGSMKVEHQDMKAVPFCGSTPPNN